MRRTSDPLAMRGKAEYQLHIARDAIAPDAEPGGAVEQKARYILQNLRASVQAAGVSSIPSLVAGSDFNTLAFVKRRPEAPGLLHVFTHEDKDGKPHLRPGPAGDERHPQDYMLALWRCYASGLMPSK